MGNKIIKIMVGGPAGAGVMSLGTTIGRIIKRHGWNVFVCDDHPSLIKGGHNMAHITASHDKIYSQRDGVDILVAFDSLTIDKHKEELSSKGVIIHDSSFEVHLDDNNISIIPVPFGKLIAEAGHLKYYNTIALGVVSRVLDVNKSIAEKVIEDIFRAKGREVIEGNKKAFDIGYHYINTSYENYHIDLIEEDTSRLFIDGNTAAALGAIKAGVKYVGMYPMTPTSPILTLMSKYEKNKKIVVKQTEDEIAAVNSIIGAGFAGARSLAATSGGGFSLMVEGLGMAGLMETPIVIIEGQRGSPSTGMPTYTEQGDLRFIMHASQGEFPRVVVAPGDVEETFYVTFDAFNIADMLQTPVIILLDKYLCSSYEVVERFRDDLRVNRGKLISREEAQSLKEFKRYALVDDGISPRSIPSYPNAFYVSSSYEHDETGFTTEDAEMRNKMMKKRMKKLNALDKDVYKLRIYESRSLQPEINIICWGSTKMPCLEAQRILEEEGIGSRILHYLYLLPFPTEDSMHYLDSGVPNLLVELNYTGQLGGIIREKTGIEIENKYLKYDGRPFMPEDIASKVKNILGR